MARPKLGEGETQRLQIKISDEELTTIDDWRFSNRVPSRSEAVRRLVQIGIAHHTHFQELGEAVLEQISARNELENTLLDYREANGFGPADPREKMVEQLFASILREKDAIAHLTFSFAALSSAVDTLYEDVFDIPNMLKKSSGNAQSFRDRWETYLRELDRGK